jgi:hypothetical protein
MGRARRKDRQFFLSGKQSTENASIFYSLFFSTLEHKIKIISHAIKLSLMSRNEYMNGQTEFVKQMKVSTKLL